jgi:hypothetical protein
MGTRYSRLLVLIAVVILTAVSALSWAGEFTVFGPQDFIRETTAPVKVTINFSVLNPNTEFFLRVYNKGLEDTKEERVSSSVISINEEKILGHENFNQTVEFVEVPVILQLDNVMEVEVRGEPGGVLTIHIVGIDNNAPDIQITDPPDGSLTNMNPYTISLSFSDDISGIDPNSFSLFINGEDKTGFFSVTATGLSGIASGVVHLAEGTNTIEASISDFAGKSTLTVSSICRISLYSGSSGSRSLPTANSNFATTSP